MADTDKNNGPKMASNFKGVSSQGIKEQLDALTRLPGMRQLLLLVVLAASVAIGITLVLWMREPGYAVLFSQLADKEAAELSQALQAANIPYRIDEMSGAIMIPPDRLREVRLKLASQGLPRSASIGFEMLEKSDGFGTSQFMENARYQHALEIELARTIATLHPVQNSRVHLAIPKASAFLRDKRQPSASVTVQLYPGRVLEKGQVAAIIHLVGSSVPNLEAGQVTVVDQQGNLLTGKVDDNNAGLDKSQLEFTHSVESSYANRIEELLIPLVGSGKVKAQVAATVDFTVTEETRETYNPQKTGLRSEQVSQESHSPGGGGGGVPGALSNQPPGPSTLVASNPSATATQASPLAAPPQAPAAIEQRDTSYKSTKNFEMDRTVSHIRQPVGTVKRLSVAVIVDDREEKSAKGAIVRKPFTEEELARLNTLVKEAVGFDASRGDSVSVINQAFHTSELMAEVKQLSWWEKPAIRSLIQQGLMAVVLIVLVLTVFRPVLSSLLKSDSRANQLALPNPDMPMPGMGALSQDVRQALSHTRSDGGQSPMSNYDNGVEVVRQIVSQDPKRVAQLVKTWLKSDE